MHVFDAELLERISLWGARPATQYIDHHSQRGAVHGGRNSFSSAGALGRLEASAIATTSASGVGAVIGPRLGRLGILCDIFRRIHTLPLVVTDAPKLQNAVDEI